MKNILILVFIVLLSQNLFSQEKVLISEGLAVVTNPPGRRSLSQIDPIENMIVNGKWNEPKDNESFKFDSVETSWFKVKAGEDGWFRDSKLRGAYLYYKYESDQNKIMILEGYNHYNVFVNSRPRIGNIYGNKEEYESWEPNFNYSRLPVMIKEGKNEFLFQLSYGRMKALLHETESIASFNLYDNTLPDVFKGKSFDDFGGIVVINSQNKPLDNASIKAVAEDGTVTVTEIPSIIPVSVRKVKFNFKGIAGKANKEIIKLELIVDGDIIDKGEIELNCVDRLDTYKQTFVSEIDGSVQYYAVKPSTNDEANQALFLSAHGARVEAFNQAGSYSNKEWGNIVCPTNRRPYGFNWEDIGRIDALEVLELAKNKFKSDENRIYLTGHSMGGHGTWHLGVNYPDQFAAIGPSAGWISLWSYRYRDRAESFTNIQELFIRAAKQSDTYTLAPNYSQLGIYVIHGDADSVVSPSQARSMLRTLSEFHTDYDSHFEPGKEHWWDVDTLKPGTDCVDWTPMFDYFARHSRPLDRIKRLNFSTAAPGIASKNYWVEIEQQIKQFDFSSINIEFIPFVNHFRVNTSNIKSFSINTAYLDLEDNSDVSFEINNKKLKGNISGERVYLTKENNSWQVKRKLNKAEKHPGRYGSFKDLFKNNLVLVYGTNGSSIENANLLAKVRYDSEMFWYAGNGSFEIIADKDFSPEKFSNNNILLYGNSEQNSAYMKLLDHSPVRITNNKVQIQDNEITGKNLGCYFVYPKKGNENNLIGVIAGTGEEGTKLTYMRPFLKPGASFPDLTVFNTEILVSKERGISAAGFFGLDWSVEKGEFIIER